MRLGEKVEDVESKIWSAISGGTCFMKKPDLKEERESFPWCVLLLGVEGHSEALSDGVRCGLSLVALELALCVMELAIVCSSW
ncbi:hypothetical protein F2Q68_00009444 [Brassica cretica]|uniref:Uncharacterized protein n=1 Tax=Brassica cretica TaxID=69181 RepID=A0A8S9KSD2_BRACR|nr:hypothetical protein F2Q68_00009444 [Brassica cretica]